MAESTQVHEPLSGSGAGNNIGSTAVPPSHPFFAATTTTSAPASQSVDPPEYPSSNPFSSNSQVPQNPPQEPVDSLPQLPPRPDLSQLQQHHPEEMVAHDTSHAATPPEVPSGDHDQTRELNVSDSQEIATLKAMFPDFDSAVMLSVLQSVNHNQDRAIDMLLSMSDPNYVSAHSTAPASGDAEDPATALALDEQLARQLALEDEEEAQRHHVRQRSASGDQPARASGQNWSRRSAGSQQPQEEKVVFQQEIQETVSRIAESGKRTFSSIVSKVKAKISEMDQNRNAQGQSSSSTQSPYETYQSGPNAPIDRHAASEAFAHEYYGSNTNSTAAGRPAAGGWTSAVQETRGYDVGEQGLDRTATQPVSVQPRSVTPGAGPGPVSRPGSEISRPPVTSSGSPIDAAKLGILPKRPVSLLGPQSASQGASSPSSPRRDPDDDDLEYMENPFEEGRK